MAVLRGDPPGPPQVTVLPDQFPPLCINLMHPPLGPDADFLVKTKGVGAVVGSSSGPAEPHLATLPESGDICCPSSNAVSLEAPSHQSLSKLAMSASVTEYAPLGAPIGSCKVGWNAPRPEKIQYLSGIATSPKEVEIDVVYQSVPARRRTSNQKSMDRVSMDLQPTKLLAPDHGDAGIVSPVPPLHSDHVEPDVNKRIFDELIEDHMMVVMEGREFCSAQADFSGVIPVPEQAEVESDSKELPADVCRLARIYKLPARFINPLAASCFSDRKLLVLGLRLDLDGFRLLGFADEGSVCGAPLAGCNLHLFNALKAPGWHVFELFLLPFNAPLQDLAMDAAVGLGLYGVEDFLSFRIASSGVARDPDVLGCSNVMLCC
ncbi:hypothetical protein Nepgr_013491 [Nepenthes gracilis]|uniref:Uncharacterized protein n=1 Tax=Nepenthes gracilis TaxID=150966 RepID=A0AAD3SIY4_NEPGR|nr:hypothetical protein Nepgr_013491 [Nepenthes gracilis]